MEESLKKIILKKNLQKTIKCLIVNSIRDSIKYLTDDDVFEKIIVDLDYRYNILNCAFGELLSKSLLNDIFSDALLYELNNIIVCKFGRNNYMLVYDFDYTHNELIIAFYLTVSINLETFTIIK